jgi:hypothetical protein
LHETAAALDVEFPKQRGDVEFDRAFRNVQLRGDFLVCKVLKHASKHVSLSRAYLNRQNRGHAGLNQFLRTRHQAVHHVLASRNHDFEVARRLPTDHALHRQQTHGLLDRHASVCVRLHFETPRTGRPIEENKGFRTDLEPDTGPLSRSIWRLFWPFMDPPGSLELSALSVFAFSLRKATQCAHLPCESRIG